MQGTTGRKKHHGFPIVIYVRKEEDGSLKYFTADKDPEKLLHGAGDSAVLARYTIADRVNAKLVAKLKEK